MSRFLPCQVIERRAVEHWKREGLSAGFDIDRLIDRLDLGLLWRPIEPVGGRQVAAEVERDRIWKEWQVRFDEVEKSAVG